MRAASALAALVLAGTAWSAQPVYSEMAPLAPRSLLLDVARAGTRIVAVGERGHILLSDDNGQTWRQVRVPSVALLTGVFFVDGQRGWVVGHDETILRSTDGGESWSLAHYAPEKQQPLLDVWFRDAHHGLAVGAYGTIYRTDDGGLNWVQQVFAPQEIPQKKPSAGVQDEGNSPADRHLNKIVRAGDGTLYLAAEAGYLFRSRDDGQTWMTLPSPYEGSFFGLLPLEGGTVIAFGLRGHLFRSADAGNTWIEAATGTAAMLTDALQLAGGEIVVSGLAGTVLLSKDGGEDFSLRQQPERKGIQALLALDAHRVLTVGEGGIGMLQP